MTRTRVTLLTVGDPGRVTGGYLFHRRLADRASWHGASMTFVSIPSVPLPWAILSGPSWLRDPATRAADVLVLDSIAASAAAPWISRVSVPVVGMLHQPLGGMEGSRLARAFRVPFDRRAYRACRVLMVASEWLAEQLVAAGVARDRLRVVPPGKDLDAAATDDTDAETPATSDLRDGRLIAVLCVANWLPRKGVLELLEAVARLPDEVGTLHLVGDPTTPGRYAGRVGERLKRPDVRDRVVVHGVISPTAVRAMYRAADVFALPSFEEPYGTVWGEAMAAGLPVVGFRAGNLPFLVDHGIEGLIAPVGDIGALSRAIEQLARDPELTVRMARAAELRAATRPTWDETAERFFAVVDEFAPRHRTLAPSSTLTERPVDRGPGVG
jgi:glycosyltransferase involved in cell wall biosynthesis